MQHISDKEFDHLFKAGLADAEVKPPASLWDQIEPQIAARKKRKMPYRWMAAASVVVALSAGIIFMQSADQPNYVQQSVKNDLKTTSDLKAGSEKAAVKENAAKQAVDADQPDVVVKTSATESLSAEVIPTPLEETSTPSVRQNEKTLIAMQPLAPEPHLIHTTPAQQAEQTVELAVAAPDMGTALASTENPTATALDEEHNAEQPERARIRNAGDLVNFVVDKLDKREQKILEFKTDDDDNSSLIAINIGPFKLNQRKHK